MPYMFNAHWYQLIVNIEKTELTLLDPYETRSDYKRAVDALTNFIRFRSGSSFGQLRKVSWIEKNIKNRTYQAENKTAKIISIRN